jgi:hypothetical protein
MNRTASRGTQSFVFAVDRGGEDASYRAGFSSSDVIGGAAYRVMGSEYKVFASDRKVGVSQSLAVFRQRAGVDAIAAKKWLDQRIWNPRMQISPKTITKPAIIVNSVGPAVLKNCSV